MIKRVKNLKRNKNGFTLVEVIVVLVILAILAALLVPALTGYIDKANEKKVIADARSLMIAQQTIESDIYAAGGYTAQSNVEVLTDAQTLSEVSGYTSATYSTNGKAKIISFVFVSNEYTATYDGTKWEITQ